MSFPINLPISTLEIKGIKLSDIQPTPTEGYETILLKDLGYTKLWIEIKLVTI